MTTKLASWVEDGRVTPLLDIANSEERPDPGVSSIEVELLRAALGALGSRFRRVALEALLETRRELRLPLPTLPR